MRSEKETEPKPAPAGRRAIVRLVAAAVGLLVAIAAAFVVPPWLTALVPGWAWKRLTLGFLFALSAGYGLVLVLAVGGTAIFGLRVIRGRRKRRPRPLSARLLALSVACLLGLIVLETSAAAWQARAHRMPRLPTRFQEGPAAARNETTILVIGESSARGEPFDDWLSIGRIVAWQLERMLPGRRFRVETWAKGGSNLEPMHQRLTELTRPPGAIFVYAGHNEFQARYPWSRTVPYYVEPGWQAWLKTLDESVPKPPLARMILETLDRHRLDLAPPRAVSRRLIDVPMYTPAEAEELRADFERRLEAIAVYCERIGSLPILVVPASNDAGFEPNRSVLAPNVPPSEHPTIARGFSLARGMETFSPAESERRYRAFLNRHPGFAEAHFRLARVLERFGNWDEARTEYRRARDLDAMPQRCPTAFQEAYHQVAARHRAVVLVDGPKVLEPIAPHGLFDDHLFHDAHHPTFLGYLALAQDLLNQLRARKAFGWPEGAPAPVIDPAECAAHFGMKAKQWAAVCEHEKNWFSYEAYLRFDPVERLKKCQRYAVAVPRIEAGSPPDEAGVPGLGVRCEALRPAPRKE